MFGLHYNDDVSVQVVSAIGNKLLVDKQALALIPKNKVVKGMPVAAIADGNCMPGTDSILAFEHERNRDLTEIIVRI